MADSEFAFGRNPDRLHRQLRQKMTSWSEHVEGWLDQVAFPVCLMRYEEMLERPHETFGDCIRFLGLETDVSRIANAVRNSSFDKLRDQERKHGFRERPSSTALFFRSGKAGDWVTGLQERQAFRIIEDHGRVMKRLGYLVSESPR